MLIKVKKIIGKTNIAIDRNMYDNSSFFDFIISNITDISNSVIENIEAIMLFFSSLDLFENSNLKNFIIKPPFNIRIITIIKLFIILMHKIYKIGH